VIVLGLTGSIAMGKSRAAAAFQLCGVPVFDADAVVHLLLSPGGSAVAAIGASFPGSLDEVGGVDRQRLGRLVFGNTVALRRLEAIIHPEVRTEEGAFLRRCCRAGVPVALLDIPLLLETGGERRVDRVVVVSAHRTLQADRALRRPSMTEEKLAQIRRKQMADPLKRRRADYVIPSGYDRGLLLACVRRIVQDAARLRPAAWPDRWLHRSGVCLPHAA